MFIGVPISSGVSLCSRTFLRKISSDSIVSSFLIMELKFRTLIVIFAVIIVPTRSYLCTEDFCPFYLEKNDCLSTSGACHIQNNTFNGEFFPAEVPCGCCEICLQNLREGEDCSVGSPDMTPPLLVCGPGLYCMKNDSNFGHTCQNMNHTECFKEQILFDENEIHRFVAPTRHRPVCDGDGNYISVKCSVGQSCFCVNQNGERIFGEAPYSKSAELTMKCECSRTEDRFRHFMDPEHPILTARCLEDGSFDPLQCMGGKCVCVDPHYGSPMSGIEIVTETNYDRMPCFDRKMHLSYKYLHECELLLFNLIQQIQMAKDQHFAMISYDLPKCQPDGWFQAVQGDGTHLFCVNKYNQMIEEYVIFRGSREAKDMDCKCARTRDLLIRNGFDILPVCKRNGNFEEIQCRGDQCYCVNSDGLQLTKLVPRTFKLVCSNQTSLYKSRWG